MKLNHTFAELGHEFSRPVELSPLESPVLASWNQHLAKELNMVNIPENLLPLLNGEMLMAESPVASLYAGHQFGVWVPQLGDGRAAILGQLDKDVGGWELQLKGSGPTPFSRGADGRAVLRSSIREYLCSEAMYGLNIPTTRALCLIDSKTPVYREEVETGALVLRMAPTHIRFGSFEVFASRNQHRELQQLADFVIDHFYPECRQAENPYLAFYEAVISHTATMMSGWMSQGFAHGVMNTDNMSILGLTIDYGPFGFMEAYNPGLICNHSDHSGRYAFNQQPNIASWNLGVLGNALLPLIEVDVKDAQATLNGFKQLYLDAYKTAMCEKLGIKSPQEGDEALVNDLLNLMADCQADYSRTFRLLSRQSTHKEAAMMFGSSIKFKQWLNRFKDRTSAIKDHENLMLKRNPKYLLRNYIAQIVIERAQTGDYAEIDRLLNILHTPFSEHPEAENYFAEAPEWAASLSVSCSS